MTIAVIGLFGADEIVLNGNDAAGRHDQIIDQVTGLIETYEYEDVHGRMTRRVRSSPLLHQETMRYRPRAGGGERLTVTEEIGLPDGAGRQVVRTIEADAADRTVAVVETIDGHLSRTEMTYDARGLTKMVTAAAGTPLAAMTWHERDELGHVVELIEPGNVRTTFRRDYQGNVLEQIGPHPGQRVQASFDALGRVKTMTTAEVTDGEGGRVGAGSWEYFYPSGSTHAEIINQNPGWTTLPHPLTTPSLSWSVVDNNNHVARIVRENSRGLMRDEYRRDAASGLHTRLEYDGPLPSRIARVEGSWTEVVETTWDARGRPTEATESWEQSGDAYAYTTSTQWLARTGSEPPRAIVTEAWASGSPGSLASVGGRTTDLELDADERVIAARVLVSGPGSDVLTEQRSRYDGAGQLFDEELVDGTGDGASLVRHMYEGSGRLKQSVQGTESMQLSYDALGRVIQVSDPTGRVETTKWDARGFVTERAYGRPGEAQLVETTSADSAQGFPRELHSRQWTRTSVGQGPPAGTPTRKHGFGPQGEILSVTQPVGDTVKYQHDALGRLVSAEATGVSQGFGWDHLDRPVLRRLGQREWTTTWNSGRAATQTPAGDNVAVRYDGRGRPYRVEQQSVGGSSEQSFSTRTMTYDGDDQLRKAAGIDAQGAATEVVIHRDATGRVLMLEQPAGLVGYTDHHPSGEPGTMHVSGEVVSYAYDTFARVSQMAKAGGPTTTVAWEPGGFGIRRLSGGGITELWCYESRGFVSRVLHGSGSLTCDSPAGTAGLLLELSYDYDDRGNRTEETIVTYASGAVDNVETTRYGYDGADRLTGVRYPDGSAVLYSVGALGQRRAERRISWYPADEPLGPEAFVSLEEGDIVYQYEEGSLYLTGVVGADVLITKDDSGRVSELVMGDERRTLSWDPEDRLVGVEISMVSDPEAGSAMVSHRYDALGRRVGTQPDWTSGSSFVWGTGDIKAESVGGAAPKVYARSGPLVASIGSERVLKDALSSPIARWDGQGLTVARRYGAFGEHLTGAPSMSEPTLGYTGHQWDGASGLVYARARWYEPALGGFMSVDPVAGWPSDPMSFAPHTYAHGNPLRYVDPDGEAVFIPVIIGAGLLVGALSGTVGALQAEEGMRLDAFFAYGGVGLVAGMTGALVFAAMPAGVAGASATLGQTVTASAVSGAAYGGVEGLAYGLAEGARGLGLAGSVGRNAALSGAAGIIAPGAGGLGGRALASAAAKRTVSRGLQRGAAVAGGVAAAGAADQAFQRTMVAVGLQDEVSWGQTALMAGFGGFAGRGAYSAARARQVSERRAYLNERFGRRGDLHRDINMRGQRDVAARRHRELVHFTDSAGRAGIRASGKSGQIVGRTGVFALPSSALERGRLGHALLTGLPPGRTAHVIGIPPASVGNFRRVLPLGPYSALKAAGGVRFTAPGVVDLGTGVFTRTGPALVPYAKVYGPDLLFYGAIAGAYAVSQME